MTPTIHGMPIYQSIKAVEKVVTFRKKPGKKFRNRRVKYKPSVQVCGEFMVIHPELGKLLDVFA